MPAEPQEPQITREVEIDASPDEVWEAVATDEGRRRWLEDVPGREIVVEPVGAPGRLVWWWWGEDGAPEPRRVELLVVASPGGTRVVVTESAPAFPLALLASAFALALV